MRTLLYAPSLPMMSRGVVTRVAPSRSLSSSMRLAPLSDLRLVSKKQRTLGRLSHASSSTRLSSERDAEQMNWPGLPYGCSAMLPDRSCTPRAGMGTMPAMTVSSSPTARSASWPRHDSARLMERFSESAAWPNAASASTRRSASRKSGRFSYRST